MLRCEMMYDRVLSQPDGADLQDRIESYLYEGLGVKQDAVLLCAAMTAAL
jgi:hypothetical protein